MMRLVITFSIFIVAFVSYGQVTNYNGSFIRFHIYGKGEPVFILSGGPGNDCHQEEDVAIKIGEKYQAILLEQRGTGLSMPPELDTTTITLDAFIKDILFVMDSLKIVGAKFYGHSWGALLATSFAAKYPEKVKALVFVGPGPMSLDSKSWNQIPQNRLSNLTPDQKKRYFELSFKSYQKKSSNEETIEFLSLKNAMNVYDTTNTEDIFAKINKGVNNTITYDLMIHDLNKIKFDLTKEIPKLKLPITIITGKQDPLAFLTEDFKNFYPNVKTIWINKSGHFPMFEQPEVFYPIFMDALSR